MINSSNKKNKGFTMVELLATVVILGILAGIGVPLVYRYLNKTRTNSYNHMLTGAYDAANNVVLEKNLSCGNDNNACYFRLSDLVENEYLENLDDPSKHGSKCDGVIRVSLPSSYSLNQNALKSYDYTCYLKCNNYSTTVKWQSGSAADEYVNTSALNDDLTNISDFININTPNSDE